jgi:acyl carrier protein
LACAAYGIALRQCAPDSALFPPYSLAIGTLTKVRKAIIIGQESEDMTDRSAMFDKLKGLIEPFNKKGVELNDATTFAGDLEWDSLTVMDFVAEVEDSFDIVITMNMQAEIETVGQLVDAVIKLTD